MILTALLLGGIAPVGVFQDTLGSDEGSGST